MTRGERITNLYKAAPNEMLSARIAPIFCEITDEASKVRHNDALADIKDIINNTHPEKGKFTRTEVRLIDKVAMWILYPKQSDFRKKRLIFRMAEEIKRLCSMKGN